MSPGFDLLLVAHVVAGIVGFGAIAAAGYEARAGVLAEDPARDLGLRRFFRPGTDWAGHAIFLVPVLGLSLLLGAERRSVGAVWPWLGLGLWLVAAGVATGVCWPAERRAQQALSRLVDALPAPSTMSAGSDRSDRSDRSPSEPLVRGVSAVPADHPPVAAGPSGPSGPALLSEFRTACRRMEAAAGLISIVFLAAVAVMIVQP